MKIREILILVVSLLIMFLSQVGMQECEAQVEDIRRAAEQGNAAAQFRLGVMYSRGIEVSKDPKEAVKWFHKAAKQENVNAQYTLSLMYRNGHSVPKDAKEAEKWYRKAVKQWEKDLKKKPKNSPHQ